MAADSEEDLEIPLEESASLVGGVEPQTSLKESYRNSYRNRGESQCKVIWQKGHLYYKCYTCGLEPSSAICYSCFHLGNHEGHDFELFVCENAGFCDCGDPASWRESGFCASNPRHPRLYSVAHEFEEEHLDSTLGGDAQFGTSSKPSVSPSTSYYYSARTQSMIENRSKFTSDVESEIEYSKVHWSEMDLIPTTKSFRELNRTCFLALRQKYSSCWEGFFTKRDDIVIGKKIAEGGQAEIYEAGEDYVVKVFHPNLPLEDLQNQWPPGMLNEFDSLLGVGRRFSLIQGGMLLKDSRFLDQFAILMERQWGDLRKLIDIRMIEGKNQGPPFSLWQVRRLMFCIARDMHLLHCIYPPILHRDLKASNVLVLGLQQPSINGKILAIVADFECSVGVVGTGFWRAPEILKQLKNGVRSSMMEFTKASDVYSFGMVCYELVTGRIPFEGHSTRDYDFILDGNRPELPIDLHPLLKNIVVDCWHADPSRRPSFLDIIAKLNEF